MSKKIAKRLIEIMRHDNGCCFEVSKFQLQALAGGVGLMEKAGLEFTEDVMHNIAAGEKDENKELYSKFEGWVFVDNILNDIFDPVPADL